MQKSPPLRFQVKSLRKNKLPQPPIHQERTKDISQNDCVFQKIQFSDEEIIKLIELLTAKNTRIFTLFSHNKAILQTFKEKHMKNNPYMKIALRKILYELGNERRVGNNLKGLSKQIMWQIEECILDLVKLQMKIFQRNEEIKRCGEVLEHCQFVI